MPVKTYRKIRKDFRLGKFLACEKSEYVPNAQI